MKSPCHVGKNWTAIWSTLQKRFNFLALVVACWFWPIAFSLANEITIPNADDDQHRGTVGNSERAIQNEGTGAYSRHLPDKGPATVQPSIGGARPGSAVTAFKNSKSIWIPPLVAAFIYLCLDVRQQLRFVTAACVVTSFSLVLYATYYFFLLPKNNVNYDKLALLIFWPASVTRGTAVDLIGQYSWFVALLEFVFVGIVYGSIAACVYGIKNTGKRTV